MGFSCPFLGRKVAKAIKIQDNSYTLGICSYHSMSFLKRKGFFFFHYITMFMLTFIHLFTELFNNAKLELDP